MLRFSATVVSLEGIDDVQDFPWETDEESSISSEMHIHLYDLMQMGNKAFRENRLDQAVEFYSRANNVKPGDSIILSSRCAAYLRISHFLKHRPPSDSEIRPLSGLDPTTHAGLALKDAEKVMSLQCNSVTSYILKANALILLEKYELARDVICSGLQIDPQSNPLKNLERSIGNIFMRRSQVKPQRTDDYDCTLCLKLLYEPITTPCGHSFCRSCLFQTMDRGNRCPLCRTVLLNSPRTCAISVTLNNIIQKNFPEEYAERKMENDSLTNPGVDLLPLFVMDAILPCQKFQLNIFEPRYRLMVRRIMEGNRRMGMVVIDSSTSSIADYACEVEITDCEPLPDGRFFLEVKTLHYLQLLFLLVLIFMGVCLFIIMFPVELFYVRLKAAGDVASFEIGIKMERPRLAELFKAQGLMPSTRDPERFQFLERPRLAELFKAQGLMPSTRDPERFQFFERPRLAELFKAQGLMPSTRDPERFQFFGLATLTNRRPSERLDLLRIRDTKERIRRFTALYEN
ncbi:lon peptidase n-terminal domain and ring finger protein 1 [Phtheirospermum japonicum]|uniref:Lon peptidase n-terminal domain and ring finger protein 1 n=1 Tax=Phtheirospermum japonicum TaxID=374723 RepID=A0A830BJ95_9LAMI|nr:lon peptidase n-terminal domain and ring finger protein 1 [Phtheirospermum japonicum]